MNITDINVLQRLKDGYSGFSMAYQSEIPRIDSVLFQKREQLIQIQTKLEHKLADAERKLQNCNNALTMCKAQIVYETDSNGNSHRVEPNCGSEESEVRNARKEQKNAQNNLDAMHQIMRAAEERFRVYEDVKQRFRRDVDENVHLAIEQLNKHQQLAEQYLQIKY
jgi:DNA repair ATPase RecN